MESTALARARKEQRRAEVKARLRAAALELAAELPFRELRIEQIAQAADLSRSAFYFYYRDKHDLLTDAAGEVAEEVYEQADRWWHGEGEPRQRIHAALTGVAELWVENADLFRIVTEVSTYDEDVRIFWRSLVGRFVESTAEHLEAERAAGSLPEQLDPQTMAELLIWGVERLLYLYIATGERQPGRLVDGLTDAWMLALYGPDG